MGIINKEITSYIYITVLYDIQSCKFSKSDILTPILIYKMFARTLPRGTCRSTATPLPPCSTSLLPASGMQCPSLARLRGMGGGQLGQEQGQGKEWGQGQEQGMEGWLLGLDQGKELQ